ncbi:MAG: FIST C-terminal domain-containing protein [Deltaproteobacteria bacterium]|nr:FIST C-terminal domain-containing protein [Deltaproteobacteria bacterium]
MKSAGAGRVDTVLLFSTTYHADPRPVVAAACDAARGARVVGCSASGVLTGEGEIEEGAGIVAMAIPACDDVVLSKPFMCAPPGSMPANELGGIAGVEHGVAMILADGYSAHPERVAELVSKEIPAGIPVVGGLAVGPSGVMPAFRWLDDQIASHGVAGLFLGTRTETVVELAQGCRPIGPAYTVTKAQGNVIAGLDHAPAFQVFAERVGPLSSDLLRAAQSVFLAVPEGDGEPEGTALLVRGFLKFDPERGLLAMSEPIAEGTRVRFALRDALAGRENLQSMLARAKQRLRGRQPRLGVYFNCAGRGRAMFGVDDHDVAYIQSALGHFPLVGFFGGGELAPLAGRSRLHLFSGVLVMVTG